VGSFGSTMGGNGEKGGAEGDGALGVWGKLETGLLFALAVLLGAGIMEGLDELLELKIVPLNIFVTTLFFELFFFELFFKGDAVFIVCISIPVLATLTACFFPNNRLNGQTPPLYLRRVEDRSFDTRFFWERFDFRVRDKLRILFYYIVIKYIISVF